mgnify:CR=1 FL=1
MTVPILLDGGCRQRQAAGAGFRLPDNLTRRIRAKTPTNGLLMPFADPPTTSRVWFRYIRLHQALYSEVATRLRVIGLSVPQFDVLSTLTEREGMSQRELADRLYVTKGNVSGLIDRLVEAGLVVRQATPDDRRSHSLYLTEEGVRLARLGMESHNRFMAETLGQLKADDVATLDRILISWRDVARTVSSAKD